MYHHLADVMDVVNVPCILYNIPGRTGCKISPAVVERLSAHPNAWGIKEASGDISYAASIAQLEMLPLCDALFCEVNPIPVKAALAKMGLLDENYRKPLWPMTDSDRERLYAAMKGAGLID